MVTITKTLRRIISEILEEFNKTDRFPGSKFSIKRDMYTVYIGEIIMEENKDGERIIGYIKNNVADMIDEKIARIIADEINKKDPHFHSNIFLI